MRGQEGELREQHCGTVSGPLQPVPGQTQALGFLTGHSSTRLSGLTVSLAQCLLHLDLGWNHSTELKEASGTVEFNPCILGEENEEQRGSIWLQATWLISKVGSWQNAHSEVQRPSSNVGAPCHQCGHGQGLASSGTWSLHLCRWERIMNLSR